MKSIIMAMLFLLNFQPALAQVKDLVVELKVTEKGFEPSSVDVKPGVPVVLKVTRKTDSTCATQIKIKSKNIKENLPLNKPVTIALGKLEKGEIRFACGMDMVSGHVLVK
jgi:plastocyanin domain-containing protein